MDWFKDVSSVEHSVWKQFTLKGYPIFRASKMFFEIYLNSIKNSLLSKRLLLVSITILKII